MWQSAEHFNNVASSRSARGDQENYPNGSSRLEDLRIVMDDVQQPQLAAIHLIKVDNQEASLSQVAGQRGSKTPVDHLSSVRELQLKMANIKRKIAAQKSRMATMDGKKTLMKNPSSTKNARSRKIMMQSEQMGSVRNKVPQEKKSSMKHHSKKKSG